MTANERAAEGILIMTHRDNNFSQLPTIPLNYLYITDAYAKDLQNKWQNGPVDDLGWVKMTMLNLFLQVVPAEEALSTISINVVPALSPNYYFYDLIHPAHAASTCKTSSAVAEVTMYPNFGYFLCHRLIAPWSRPHFYGLSCQICHLLHHSLRGTLHYWALLELLPKVGLWPAKAPAKENSLEHFPSSMTKVTTTLEVEVELELEIGVLWQMHDAEIYIHLRSPAAT